MVLDVAVCRSVQAPAAALCSGLQHNTAAAAAAYLQQHLLTYNPATVANSALPFAAIKQSAPAFTAPLGKRHIDVAMACLRQSVTSMRMPKIVQAQAFLIS